MTWNIQSQKFILALCTYLIMLHKNLFYNIGSQSAYAFTKELPALRIPTDLIVRQLSTFGVDYSKLEVHGPFLFLQGKEISLKVCVADLKENSMLFFIKNIYFDTRSFLKMGKSRPLFCLFLSFPHYNFNKRN